MQHSNRGKARCCLAVASILAMAQAQAQLDEVVVTAQRVETDLQKTPAAVTTFTSETLAELGVNNLLDLGNFTPNLVVYQRTGQGGLRGGVAIRGMGVESFAAAAAVGLYVDEVFYPAPFGNLLGMFDIARVEVLRGPQGTLFGRNTIAGAVQYLTARPGKEFGGHVAGTVGNNERTDIDAALNVPLSDTVSARLSVGYSKEGGYVHDTLNNVDRGEQEHKIGRLQLRWEPSERLSVNLKAEGLTQDGNGRAIRVTRVNTIPFGSPGAPQFVSLQFLPPSFGGLGGGPLAETRPITNAYVSTGEYQFAGFSGHEGYEIDYVAGQAVIDYQLSDNLSLKSISAYSSIENLNSLDIDNLPLFLFEAGQEVIDGKTGDRGSTELFTQELQLRGQAAGDRLQWTAGLYYYDGSEDFSFYQRVGRGTPVNAGGDTVTDTESRAIYGQVSYDLTDRLTGTVGLRYSREDIDGTNLGNTQPVARAPYGTNGTFSDTSPHVGLDFRATDAVMFYAKASKGFRAGGVTLNAGFPTGGIAYGPETAWTYEAGARMEFLNRRLRFNPTVFFTRWKDLQFGVRVPTGSGGLGSATQNAGDAELKGVELEWQLAATDRVILTGSASYLNAEYTRIDRSVNLTPAGLFVNNIALSDDLAHAPEYKVAIGGRYAHPLAQGAEIVSSLDYAWTDDQRSAVVNLQYVEQPAYGLLNARIQYNAPGNRWSAALFGTNLADEYYVVSGQDILSSGGTRTEDPGRPREYGVTVHFNF